MTQIDVVEAKGEATTGRLQAFTEGGYWKDFMSLKKVIARRQLDWVVIPPFLTMMDSTGQCNAITKLIDEDLGVCNDQRLWRNDAWAKRANLGNVATGPPDE